MKFTKFTALLALLALFSILSTPANAQLVAREQGGNQLTVRSGGTVVVKSGATLQLDSGSTLTVNNSGLAALNTNAFTATGAIVDTAGTTDLNPAFGTAILGNPVSKTTYGTCTVAAVNGGTCIPLAGATSRTISVTHFDIVAAGSAATCTGILLEDTNNSPVVIATLAAATLTSGAHNVPLAATLGVGFGAGSGLTAAKGVQIKVNGSNCTTTTAFNYAITYTVQ